MKFFIFIVLLNILLYSCSGGDSVQISGRVENGDSIVSILVEDSIYSFLLDENDFFEGEIPLKKPGYATLLYNSLNLYLSPDEDLEVYVNALNFSSSLYFRGSLGGRNNYLKEQEVAVFFDKDDYKLGENDFVKKMQLLINEKTKLLEAKNFDKAFTALEKERIRYSIAGRVSYYPLYRINVTEDKSYEPGTVFVDFISSFPLNNEAVSGTRDFRTFVLNYVYWKGNMGKEGIYSNDVIDYILSTMTNPAIKDFLLTEIVHRYVWENNGLDGADYLMQVFRRECSDKNKIAYIDELATHWEKLETGRPAPDFVLKDTEGRTVTLSDYKGTYLYIMVWATWCVPCKNELTYLNQLQKIYEGKNIRFLTIAIDEPALAQHWHDFLKEREYAGVHTMADSLGRFNENYMIISVPRFILIGPQSEIINSNAPRFSGQICLLLDSLEL